MHGAVETIEEEASRRFPWCFDSRQMQMEDADRARRGKKPREWQYTQTKAIEQVAAARRNLSQ